MYGAGPKLFAVLLLGIFCCKFVNTIKLKLASEHDCDRHSLEALYYEKYAPETENAFAGVTEFVRNSIDRVTDSLISLMAELPGRESSDKEEQRVHLVFDEMKRIFARSVKKLKSNVTSAWESLIEAHYSLMLDDRKFSLSDVRNRTNYVADSYASSRSSLDEKLGSIVSGLKEIIHNSLKGISTVAEAEIKNEEAKKSNISESSDDEESDDTVKDHREGGKANQEFSKDELLKNKKKEMAKSLAPGFLGKVSVIIIDKDVNLEKDVTKKSEDRDSVLDDMYFELVMIRSRTNSIIHQDTLRTKELRDLARRNLYIYFAEKAKEMYEDRIEKKSKKQSDSHEKPQSWKNEDDLAEALVLHMENYP